MKIFLCGDSTAASYGPGEAPLTGWGQVLPELLPGTEVDNRAKAGRSTKSYLAEGRLQAIEPLLRRGDLLLVQFGHNDGSSLVWRHTDPWTSFMNNLAIFADTALLAGAIPVLMTSGCCRNWEDGELKPSLGDYPEAVRVLAAKKNLPLIDLYAETFRAVREAGEEKSREWYLHVAPGEYPRFPQGTEDNTHTRRAGAEVFGRLAAEGLKRLGLV